MHCLPPTAIHKEKRVRILSNENLIRTRSLWSGRFMFVGFGLTLLAAVLIFYRPTDAQFVLLAYIFLIGGFIISNIGAGAASKWRREPRPDQALAKALKGLDNRHRLYNYLLPAEHVLLTPTGIKVFQVRRIAGDISCNGDKWSHKRGVLAFLRFAAEEQLGNPTRDIQRDLKLMQEFLDKNLEGVQVPMQGLILFAHPAARLTLTNPSVPVLTNDEVKPYLRKELTQAAKLDADTYDDLADLFDSVEGAEETSEPEPEPAAKRTTRAKGAKTGKK